MDLQFYFDPVDFEKFQIRKKYTRYNLGYYIEKATAAFREGGAKPVAIALIGVPEEHGTPNKGTSGAPDMIRRYLYELSNYETSRRIVDLGNLKKGKSEQDTYFALRDVIDYLTEKEIIAVVLGGGQDLSIGIARAFRNKDEFTLSIVDARVDVKTQREISSADNFISRIIRENPDIFHLQMIGIQEHYVSPLIFEFLKKNTFDYLQLGSCRQDMSLTEPLLRNTHFLSIDISALRKSDASAHYRPSPNGFYAEEACLVARYAGQSTRLTVFGLFEVNPEKEKSGQTAELAAQMVWYFCDGAIRRRKEDPSKNKSAFTHYFVEMEDHGETFVFYHQASTGRWWIEIFPEEGKSWVLACKESDYKQAIAKEIPDICWKYVRKTLRLSK
jgi:formiminoglutamase